MIHKMMARLRDNRGNSMIELIMVMMLLVLFSVTIYTVIYAGSETQAKILAGKDSQIDARIALSYVNVQIRQNDVAGRVFIEPHPETNENSIVFRIRDEYDEESGYDVWIFYYDDKIYEFLGSPDDYPSVVLSTEIVSMPGMKFTTRYDEAARTITNVLEYDYGASEDGQAPERRRLSSDICLRTANKGGVTSAR